MRDEESLEISEIFYSIQGESSYAGYPCVFVRLAGCNLRCSYCDARYTYEENPQSLSFDRIQGRIEEYPVNLVEITGGEPLLQENSIAFMQRLLDCGITVLLETNGSLPIDAIPPGVIKIIDIKCPDSGMCSHTNWRNMHHLQAHDEIKFVLNSLDDYHWAKEQLNAGRIPGINRILFSPVVNNLHPADLANRILADGLPVQLQLQLHTILWPGQSRGV